MIEDFLLIENAQERLAAIVDRARRLPPLTSAPAWMALAASLLLGFWAGSAGLVDGLLLDTAPDGNWSAIDLSLRDDGDGA